MTTDSHSGVFVLHETVDEMHGHEETSHTDYGLTYLADGWLRMVHGREIEVRAGSITIIPAGVPHRPLEGRGAEFWLAGFCATCLGLDESQLLMSPFRRVRQGALPVVAIPQSRQARVLRLFDELREEGERGAPESPELTRSLLLLILGEVRRAMGGNDVAMPEGSLVQGALEFIQRRCLEAISLEDVARSVHRSPAHVTATLKKETGYSVGEWINAGRVAEAANRLTHTDDSLDEIAAHVGWKDKTHFIRQFKKAHGVTPAAFRRERRHDHQRG